LGTYTTADLYLAAAAMASGLKPISSRFEGDRLEIVFPAAALHQVRKSHLAGQLQVSSLALAETIKRLFHCLRNREPL
jgi:hypothetical protein